MPLSTVPAFSSAPRCSGLIRIAFAAPIETSAAAPAMPSTESDQDRTWRATPNSADSAAGAATAFCGAACAGVFLRVVRLRAVGIIDSMDVRWGARGRNGKRTPRRAAAAASLGEARRPGRQA